LNKSIARRPFHHWSAGYGDDAVKSIRENKPGLVDVYRSFTEPGLTCMFVTMLPTVDIIMVVTVMMFVYTLSRF